MALKIRVPLPLRRDAERPGRRYHAERGNEHVPAAGKIVPALRVGMQPVTLRVTPQLRRDAERPRWRYHAERGNEHVPAAGKIVPALRVGMQPVTLRVTPSMRPDAERPGRRYHAERWERADQNSMRTSPFGTLQHDRM